MPQPSANRIAAALALAALLAPAFAHAAIPPTARGRILLDVGAKGEAWYVDPVGETKAYLANGDAAYSMLRTYGLGITDADLAKIPVGVTDEELTLNDDVDADDLADDFEQAVGTNPARKDSDDDGFSDKDELAGGFNPNGPGKQAVDKALVNRLAGRILIQVQGRGQAWYVHPVDKKRYYMRDGDAAYQVMRNLGLGATTATIAGIATSHAQVDCGTDMACLATSIENGQAAYAVGGTPDPLSTEAPNKGAISLLETFWNVATGRQVFLITAYDSADLTAAKPSAVLACDVGADRTLPNEIRGWATNDFGGASQDQTGAIGGDLAALSDCVRLLPDEAAGHGAATTHPAVVPATLVKLAVARQWARDSARVADVSQVKSALEQYFADQKLYPSGTALLLGGDTAQCLEQTGFGAACSATGTTYLGKVPAAPTPIDGACTGAQNGYEYTASADLKSYAISFCLGQPVGSVDAGVRTIDPSGVR